MLICPPLAIPAAAAIEPPPATVTRHQKRPAGMGIVAGMAGMAGSEPPNFSQEPA